MVSALHDGRVSTKAWARLHPTEHGKGGKGAPAKMADFNSKAKDDGRGSKGHKAARTRHIDHKQTQGTAANAGGKAPFGGMASKGPTPTTRAINEKQKPEWPKHAGKTGHAVKGGTTNPSGPQYGGPPNRQRPARV